MTLIQDQKVSDIFDTIWFEISRYKGLSRADIFSKYIDEKLAAALRRYNKEIDDTSEYLLRQESTRVFRALTRIQKRNDRQIIDEQLSKNKSIEDNSND